MLIGTAIFHECRLGRTVPIELGLVVGSACKFGKVQMGLSSRRTGSKNRLHTADSSSSQAGPTAQVQGHPVARSLSDGRGCHDNFHEPAARFLGMQSGRGHLPAEPHRPGVWTKGVLESKKGGAAGTCSHLPGRVFLRVEESQAMR